MTIADLAKSYLKGETTAINFIRTLSGMFNPDHAISILTIICAITRIEEGDLDKDTFWKVYLKQEDSWQDESKDNGDLE